jgi:hypothetical protein
MFNGNLLLPHHEHCHAAIESRFAIDHLFLYSTAPFAYPLIVQACYLAEPSIRQLRVLLQSFSIFAWQGCADESEA